MTDASGYDVIVVGSGLGGLICAAVLAKLEGKRVLVLEKNADIGGKIMSYGYLHNPDLTEAEYRESLGACGHSKIVHADPPFADIVEKHGLFRNYIVDTGWHQMSLGPRNRFAQIATALGRRIPVSPTIGFLYYQDGRFQQISEIVAGWPKSSQAERRRVAGLTSLISKEESHRYDHVDYHAFLESVTSDRNVIDYYGLMGCYSAGLNDPRTVSAGEIIRVNNMNNMAGTHFQKGGGGGVVTGGFKVVADTFADVVREHGGEIRTRHQITEILIEDHQAVGVRYRGADGVQHELRAPTVISNIPPRYLGNIIPERYWPLDHRQRIETQFPLAGLLGFMGLKEPIETGDGRAGSFSIRQLPGTDHLDVIGEGSIFSFEQTSEADRTRAKDGKCLMNLWISLYPKSPFGPAEITNDELIATLVARIYDFMRAQYPQWDDVYEWGYFTRSKDMYGMSIAPGQLGDRRLPIRHPTVANLFHTGDNVEQWGIASDGVGLGAALTLSAVTGKDYTQLIVPGAVDVELRFTEAEEAFRDEVRGWVRTTLPEAWRATNLANDRDERDRIDQEWDRLLYAKGWAMPSWPRRYGGMDASLAEQLIFFEEMARADAPKGLWQGKGLVGPTILKFGTEEQKQRFIPPILRGDVVWCQGWSEPGAGSDLGNLTTRAVVDGGDLVITGQKIWSTWGHIADWCFALVRTSDTQPGHRGLTYVLVDVRDTPGVTVRPIRQITGDRDFSEIYFDDARVPMANVIGGIDQGWNAAMLTLADERTTAYFDLPIRHLRILDQLVALARQTILRGRPAIDDPLTRQKLAQCRIEIDAFRHAVHRTVSAKMRGEEPGPESWMLKVWWTEAMQRLSAVALDIEEPLALLKKGSPAAPDHGHWPSYYLWMKSETIAGGTSDINRNTLAERILGMPR